MAELSGKQGKIEYGGGHVAAFDNWTFDVDVNMLDVTTFSTATLQWRDMIPGLSGFTADASGNFDVASTGLADLRTATLTPSTGTANFWMDKVGGEQLSGSVYVTTMSHSAAIDGKVEVDFSFQGTGAVTYSTST